MASRDVELDNAALAKEIIATHAHAHDIKDLNVRLLLSIVEDILRLAKPINSSTDDDTSHVKQVEPHSDTMDSSNQDPKVRLLIGKISCEIIYRYFSRGEPAHSVTMDILKSLANYSWDAKVVITLAALAISYGLRGLRHQNRTNNTLAKHIAILKDLPYPGKLEEKFNLLNDVTMKVIHCLVDFKDATTLIPIAVYWTIRSLIACAATPPIIPPQFRYMTSTAESWQLSTLAHKLSVISGHLRHQPTVCMGSLEREEDEDAYLAFKRLIDRTHFNNINVLRAMIRTTDTYLKPLYNGSRRINERVDALKSKYVLLLISDLGIRREEVHVLHKQLQGARRHEYEVLWLPIVDPKRPMTREFLELRNHCMPWYSVDHPELIDPAAVRYICEELKFMHMPMLIVLDPHGKPSKHDALPMIWIWGSQAFPFTKARESAPWDMELLADSIDPRIQEWMRSDSVVCLYGGEDMGWIRSFTVASRAAATALHVPLEMLYVGKRDSREGVRRCHEAIEREKLSHVIHSAEYYEDMWYFWVRLWTMWNSKEQLHHVLDILTLESTEQGWAVFGRNNREITKAKGDVVLPVMENYAAWAHKVDRPDKFVSVLDEEIREDHHVHRCNRLILPSHAAYAPDDFVCSNCGSTMVKYALYRCCTD